MTGVDVLIVAVKVVAAFAFLMVNVLLLVWAERKIVADMQNRIGPDRAGPWGILQTLADGLKLFFKEQVTPLKVELGMYMLAPVWAVVPAFLTFLIIPIGPEITIAGREVALVGTDLNVGLLFFLAMSSLAVYAIVLAGWSSGSKYPLLGGVRATAQAISYEAALGLALVSLIVFVSTTGDGGTLSVVEIVRRQQGSWGDVVRWLGPVGSLLPRWNVFPMLIPFGIFFLAGVAETNRAPFDLVEAEQELVGGFHTEYSGIRFAMFFLAEYINMFNISALAAALFFGGWGGPTFSGVLPGFLSALMPVVWFLVKTWALIFVFMWIRATLPRLRYDQLMTLGWKRLIPAALVWLIVSTVVIAIRQFGLPWAAV